MKAVIFYHHTYKQIVICKDEEVDNVINNYCYGEFESYEVCDNVLTTFALTI